ncbi:MAG: hypothetical protein ABR913_03895 [Sedimentisphaerales bacterium]|jgi:hypothetical protein
MNKETRQRIADYAICHLGETASKTAEITEDIAEMLTHPHRNPRNEPSLELWRKLARENIEYVSQGLRDLRELEKANSVKKIGV